VHGFGHGGFYGAGGDGVNSNANIAEQSNRSRVTSLWAWCKLGFMAELLVISIIQGFPSLCVATYKRFKQVVGVLIAQSAIKK
jgi:hypothetical protein